MIFFFVINIDILTYFIGKMKNDHKKCKGKIIYNSPILASYK